MDSLASWLRTGKGRGAVPRGPGHARSATCGSQAAVRGARRLPAPHNIQPPSMTMVWPVTKALSSLAR